MKNSKGIVSNLTILILFVVIISSIVAIVLLVKPRKIDDSHIDQSVVYNFQNEKYSLGFKYSPLMGNVIEEKGEYVCPDDDTYMTADTLVVYDKEFRFKQKNLPGSQSFLVSGIRIHRLDGENLNDCGDKFLQNLALMKGEPEMLSSIKLQNFTVGSLDGAYNEEASRLNTASRRQYTLFSKNYVIQVYGVFVPYYGSSELIEMETKFAGDMKSYILEGETAEPIREHFKNVEQLAKSIIFNQYE